MPIKHLNKGTYESERSKWEEHSMWTSQTPWASRQTMASWPIQQLSQNQPNQATKDVEMSKDRSSRLPTHLPALSHIQNIWEANLKLPEPHHEPAAYFWARRLQTWKILHKPAPEYEKELITGAAFVDLSAAYDTVNHRILVQKLSKITKDANLTALIQNMLENRRFFVDLRVDRSRWRSKRMGFLKAVFLPLCFSTFTPMTNPSTQTPEASWMLMTSVSHLSVSPSQNLRSPSLKR